MDTTRVRLCFQVRSTQGDWGVTSLMWKIKYEHNIYFIIQVFQKIGELQSEDSKYLQPLYCGSDPMCSEVIVDKHAHQQLRIDASAPIIATDEGNG